MPGGHGVFLRLLVDKGIEVMRLIWPLSADPLPDQGEEDEGAPGDKHKGKDPFHSLQGAACCRPAGKEHRKKERIGRIHPIGQDPVQGI